MSDQETPGPKIHIDSDWKAQAQAEKAKLAEQDRQAAEEQGEGQGQLPPADFKSMVSGMVSQALLYMGGIPDPMTGQRLLHMELAKHHIDLLGVLEEKVKGNLNEEEGKLLTQALHELRLSYVQLSKQVAEHMKKQAAGQTPQGPGAEPKKGGIIY